MDEFNEGVERVTAGLEKKQRIIHEDEKQRVAYHESGHALVAYSLPNTDPVHKVSIIPRGLAALGYTMQRPEDDRYLMTQGELESRIQVLLAGTIAEETDLRRRFDRRQNDLERASEIARSMVMDYGMSRLGRVNYRESLAQLRSCRGDGTREHSHSEQTAREIDQEVQRIIDESIEKGRIIVDNRVAALGAMSTRLIEKEVDRLGRAERSSKKTSPSPVIVPGTSHRAQMGRGPPFRTPQPNAARSRPKGASRGAGILPAAATKEETHHARPRFIGSLRGRRTAASRCGGGDEP